MLEIFVKYLLLFIAILNFFFCYLILQHTPKKLFHYFLAGIAFFSGFYLFTTFVSYLTSDEFWIRINHLTYAAPLCFVLFTLSLKKTSYFRLKAFLYFLPLPFLVYLAIFTDLVLKGMDFSSFPFKTYVGPLDLLGRIYLVSLLTIGIWNLVKIYRESRGFKRMQLRYFLLGVLIYCLLGGTTVGIYPILFGQKIPLNEFIIDIGVIFSLSWVILSSYAVLFYRLFDINFVLGKIIAYFLSLVSVGGAGLLMVYLNNQTKYPISYNALLPIFAIIAYFLFKLHYVYEDFSTRYFSPALYRLKLSFGSLEEKLHYSLDLNTFSQLIVDTFEENFKLRKFALIMSASGTDRYKIQKLSGFKKQELELFIKNKLFLQRVKFYKKPFGIEELTVFHQKFKNKRSEIKLLNNKIKELEIELFVPLLLENKIIGIIILGNKYSDEAFSKQEVMLLGNISRHISIALRNASLYGEIKKRKEDLEKFYKMVVYKELKIVRLNKKVEELEMKLKNGDRTKPTKNHRPI